MRRQILMPPVTPSMVDGKIARWHVAEGQAVSAGDVLAEVSTATASLEIEAEDAGQVERILVPAGTEGVKVNTPIAIVSAGAQRPPQAPLGFASLGPLAALNDAAPDFPSAPPGSHGVTYREALRDAIAHEMRADANVFLIGVDVAQNRGAQKVAQGLLDEFGPSRVVSVPALDDALFGVAVGAAMAGLRPIVDVSSWGRALEIMTAYLEKAAETFYLSGGQISVPIVFRGQNGFVEGATGTEARCVAGLLAQIPGLLVVQPATPASAAGAIAAALRHGGPVCILEHERLYGAGAAYDAAPSAHPLTAARVARPGSDATLAASGAAVVAALHAAAQLATDGFEVEVIDLVCVHPLDVATVAASAARTGRLVSVEEGWGVGAALAAGVVERCFASLRAPPVRISGAEVPMPYAQDFQTLAVPDGATVAREVANLIRKTALR